MNSSKEYINGQDIRKEELIMSKDISTPFTKEKNKKCGRTCYYNWKREKETEISPRDYGMFLLSRKRR